MLLSYMVIYRSLFLLFHLQTLGRKRFAAVSFFNKYTILELELEIYKLNIFLDLPKSDHKSVIRCQILSRMNASRVDSICFLLTP